MRKQILAVGMGVLALSGFGAAQGKDEKAAQDDSMAAIKKLADWVSRINLHGDLRYRHESIDAEGAKARHRHRIRARLGLKAKVTEEVSVAFQFATGSADPVSTNQSLDGASSSKELWLDMAYFKWSPGQVEGLHVLGGKVKNPFYKPAKTELLWDGDLRPEGVVVAYTHECSDRMDAFVNVGGLWAEERSANADSGLLGAQVGGKFRFSPWEGRKAYVKGAVGYFHYTNLEGRAPLFDTTDSFGNTVDGSGNYMYDYELLEVIVEVGTTIEKLPVAAFFDWVANQASDVKKDQGWLAGFTVGKCKKPHSWAFRYNYRDLEKDAVLGAWTDSDFIGGGTDGKGHEVGFDFQIAKHWKAGATFFHNETPLSGNEREYQRFQLDVIFKF